MIASTPTDRDAIRAASLRQHNLTDAALFDHFRPAKLSGGDRGRRTSPKHEQSGHRSIAMRGFEAQWWHEPWFAKVWADVFLSCLTDREARALQLRFGLGNEPEHTQSETAERMGVTQQRIQAMESNALKKLRLRYGTPDAQDELLALRGT